MGKEIVQSILELLNCVKLTISCNTSKMGLSDFFTSNKFEFDCVYDENSGDFEIRFLIKHHFEETTKALMPGEEAKEVIM